MKTLDLNLCFNTSLTYLFQKHGTNKIFSNHNVSHEEIAIDVTASLFKKNENGAIEFNNPKIIKELHANINNESEFLFTIISTIKEKIDTAIKFEMLKYDLISIEEYNTNFK